MEFFNEAVRTLETIVEALNRTFGKDYPPRICGYPAGAAQRQDFGKTMVRVKKHVRPPVRADPKKRCGAGRQKPVTDSRQTIHLKNRRKIYGFLYYSCFNNVNLSRGLGRRRWGVGCDQPHGRVRVGQPCQQCSCTVKKQVTENKR